MELIYDFENRLAHIKNTKNKELLKSENKIKQNNKLCSTIILVKIDAANSYYLNFFIEEVIEILSSNTTGILIELVRNDELIYAIYHSESSHSDYLIIERALYINTLQNAINNITNENPETKINTAIVINSVMIHDTQYIYHHREASLKKALADAYQVAKKIHSDNLSPISIFKLPFKSYLTETKDCPDEMNWFKEVDQDKNNCFYNGDVFMNDFFNWIENGFSFINSAK